MNSAKNMNFRNETEYEHMYALVENSWKVDGLVSVRVPLPVLMAGGARVIKQQCVYSADSPRLSCRMRWVHIHVLGLIGVDIHPGSN